MRSGRRGLVLFGLLAVGSAGAAAGEPAQRLSIAWRSGHPDSAFELRLRTLFQRFEPETPIRLPIHVTVFADLEQLATEANDSRFATAEIGSSAVELRVAADSPRSPDLLAPVVAEAAFASANPEAGRNLTLLRAWGAVLAGAWWGRKPSVFAFLLGRAGIDDIGPPEPDEKPDLLRIGEVASVLMVLSERDPGRALRSVSSGRIDPKLWAQARAIATSRPQRSLPARRLRGEPFRGISWAMTNSIPGSYYGREAPGSLDRLKADGADAVSIMPFAFQRRPDSPEIHLLGSQPRGETDEAIFRAITAAHERGMAAFVKPQIWIPDSFPGEIGFSREQDWDAWFRSYRRFVLREAVVSEAAGEDLFDVGVELTRTESRQGEWRKTIAVLREATGAPLLYSCNWASDAAAVPFWDALDAIGVDLYDPLSRSETAADGELEAGARRLVGIVSAAAARASRRFILTEVGYPSVAAAWLAPNEEHVSRAFSTEDQARSARALLAAAIGSPGFAGLFWWKAFSNGKPAGAGEKSFNVIGRPVETVLREAFSRLR